jgi:hypothetical protein
VTNHARLSLVVEPGTEHGRDLVVLQLLALGISKFYLRL